MNFGEAFTIVKTAKSPLDVFGNNPDVSYRKFAQVLHPDVNSGNPEAIEAFKMLNSLRDKLNEPKIILKSKTAEYKIRKLLAKGDLADVYETETCVVKAVRNRTDSRFMNQESKTLTTLWKDAQRFGTYLPKVVESFDIKGGRRAIALEQFDNHFDLKQAKEKYKVDARHIAWFFKRLLAAAGYAHQNGIVHGAILPPHVLVKERDTGIKLLDWTQSLAIGEKPSIISMDYEQWYPSEVLNKQPANPSTDIYMAAKCCIYLAGGDVASNQMPDHIPSSMRYYLQLCTHKSCPRNAWELHEEFNDLLKRLFGPPKFHPLET